MECTPGLLRIICIDAHIPGKRMEVKLAQHANISGSNGSGKTTLLKLVPFFFGATPSELVERVGKKTSFTDFYLSRPTSLIVFEYMTRHGPKCVAVYRHATGMKPAYRFLDEPFVVAYFSEEQEGQPVFIDGRSLGRHWTTLRLGHSKQLDIVTDYRAVIQGDRSLINRSAQSRELKSLVAMYSLGSDVGTMGHINKMTAAILSRRGSMEGIKQMIAEIMREEQIELPPLKLHKNVRDIVAELSVLRHLDNNEALFQNVVSLGVSHVENAQLLLRACAELHAYSLSIKARIGELDEKITENREAIDVLKCRWEDDGDDIKSQLQDAKLALRTAERQLNVLEQAYEHWGEQNILRKKADYENLAEFQELLSDAKQRLRALEDGVSDLKQHYDALTHQEHQRHNKKTAQLADSKLQKSEAKSSEEKRWLAQARAIENEQHCALKDHSEKRNKDMETLKAYIAETGFAAHNTLVTEEETLAFVAAENERDELEERLSLVNNDAAQAQQLADRLRDEASKAEKAFANARKIELHEESTYTQLQQLCTPKPGSLLSELREKDPGWHATLGKVIREELLTQKDLSPVYIEGKSPDVMGWSLNLDNVDTPEWACSQEKQEQRLLAQETRLELAGKQRRLKKTESEDVLAKFNSAYEACQEALRMASQAARRYESAKDAVRSLKLNNHQAAVERQQRAQERLSTLENEMDELKGQIAAELEAIEARFSVTYREAQGQHASQLSLLEEALDIVNAGLEEENTRYQKALAQIQQEFKTQCASKGLDDAVMDTAIQHHKHAQREYDKVFAYQEVVMKYDHWYRHEWSRRIEYEKNREEASTQVNHFDAQYKDAERHYKSERDRLNHQYNQLRDAKSTESDRRDACASMLKRTDVIVTDEAAETHRPLDSVLTELESLLTEQQAVIKQIRSGIGKVESVIASQGEANHIADVWFQLKRQAETKLTDAGNMDLLNINLTQSLDELLRVHLPQKKETIDSFVRTICDQLADFYVGLKHVSKLIKQQSRAVSSSISEKQYFSAIGSIGVSLNSRIDSQDYWPYLESFERAYREWKASDELGLPPKALDEQLVSVTDILHRSHVAKGIESVFDLEISLEENGRVVVVTNSRDLENASSNGLSYLILCSIFAGITRMLCRDHEIRIHWPVDELGVIDAVNVASLFRMLNDHNIVMVGGFPTTDPLLLQHFTDRHEMRKGEGLVDIQLPEDKLAALMASKQKHILGMEGHAQ